MHLFRPLVNLDILGEQRWWLLWPRFVRLCCWSFFGANTSKTGERWSSIVLLRNVSMHCWPHIKMYLSLMFACRSTCSPILKSFQAQFGFHQKKCLKSHRSFRKRKTRWFTVHARVIKLAEPSCVVHSQCISHGSNSLKVGWRVGKPWAIRSSHTKNPSISTQAPSRHLRPQSDNHLSSNYKSRYRLSRSMKRSLYLQRLLPASQT